MKKRNCANIIRCLFLLGLALIIMGCSPGTGTQVNQATKTKEGAMEHAYNTESATIPPIDAKAPTKYETASFGLG